MVKKLPPKSILLLLATGTLSMSLVGLIGFALFWSNGRNVTKVEAEEELNAPSVVFDLAILPTSKRDAQLEVIASAETPSLDRSRARFLLASDLIAQYQGGPAIKQLEGLEEEYSVLAPYILVKRARALELTNENSQAVDTWQQVIELYPDSPAVAEAMYYLGKYKKEYWEKAIAQFPQNPWTWEIIQQKLAENPAQPALMLIILRYNPFSDQLVPISDRLVKNHSQQLSSEDWQLIAQSYWQAGEYYKAAQAYRKSPRTPLNLYRIGRGLQISKKNTQAIAAYEELIKSFPQAPETAEGLIRMSSLANTPQAIAYLEQVIKNFPTQAPAALEAKSKLLERLNDQAGVAKTRQTLLESYPKSAEAADYRWQVAQKFAQEGDLRQAWQWAQPISANNPESSVAPKAAFWVGKWAQKLGYTKEAQAAFIHTLGNYPQSYYAWRAAVHLGWNVGDFQTVRELQPSLVKPKQRITPPFGSAALQEFYRLGLDEQAWILFRAEVANPWELTVDEQFTLGLLKQTQQKYLQGINLISDLRKRQNPEEKNQWLALRKTVDYWQALFPFPYYDLILSWSQQRNLNPLLVTALMRQESRFEKEIRSPVGATGLMQVMPSTGEWIAQKIDLEKYSLTKPSDNINLGTWYLEHTHEIYDNNSLLAIASYNAGPGNVNTWTKRYSLSDPDEFVENIPFRETKGYVESVFGNYWNYLRIYDPQITELMSKLSQEN